MNQLITNNKSSNFYNHLTTSLCCCEYFIFNVAFINFSGLQLLLEIFKDLEEKGIKGKILTSTYLNFTEAKALDKLREFSNIEIKIHDNSQKGFHSKAYIFKYKNSYEVIVGSSNITASAFKTNIEWNVKTQLKEDDVYLKQVLNEFDLLWDNSFYINKEFLERYEDFCNSLKNTGSFIFKKVIKSNAMQKEALKRLKYLRKSNEIKALVIAATGSGKTYLSALDVKESKPKKLLFLVHRENILIKAKESFEFILEGKVCGLYTGNKKELNASYLFSTIQTMSSNFNKFKVDEFDYIIVDEAHHCSSPSYNKVLNYFKPSFLLGLTATPNRMDNNSIYEYFDDNIACDIRLSDALDYNLVSPFHYYGISDIKAIDYESIDITNISELAKLLMVNKRVDYIIDKMNFYDFSGEKRKVLAFCASKEHAKFMSDSFNERGITSIYLTSEDTIVKREDSIRNLEDLNNPLNVIFTIDIFNEGVDIPSVNTVLLLRPTNSPIIFIQQLGRGLRKHKDKEFLTILDFIGNHKKSYLIVLALMGNKIIDKESIKLAVKNSFANINSSFISMDEISKQRILTQIENENFNTLKYLKEEYFELKKLNKNKIPMLIDFLPFNDLINPLKFINESKSYIEFLAKVEKSEEFKTLCLNENFIKVMRFIESMLPIKRVHEFVVLKYFLTNNECSIETAQKFLKKYLVSVNKNTVVHCFEYLNQNYFDKAQVQRYLKLVELKNGTLVKTEEFSSVLENKKNKEFIESSLEYGIINYENSFGIEDYGMPFIKLYEKYNMLNIAQLCNFNKIHSSFRGSGFLKYNDDFFLFITIEKDKFTSGAKYCNDFLNKDTFTFISKPSHSSDKGDGYRLINNTKEKVKLHIFVRKFAQVDKKTQNFIYLGLANTVSANGSKPITLKLKLQNALDDKLYEEFTKIV